MKVLAILDRRMGGSDELRRRGYDFAALLEADADGNIAPANADADGNIAPANADA